MVGPRALRLALASVVLLAGAAMSATGARACDARIELDPPEAWVGQQVIHETVIDGVSSDATIEWLQPPDFPDMRATLLPPAPHATSDRPGTRRQRRALYPARAGRISLPPTPYLCVPAGGGAATRRATPAALLVAKAPPRAGRPATWRGLVGQIGMRVEATATTIHVGDAVSVIATITGSGLLRQASFAWPEAELRASPVEPELFASPPLHHEQPGLRSVTRRIETLEIVPHGPGQLWVPSIEVAWLDPETGRYASSASEAFAIEVRPEPLPNASQASGGAPETARTSEGARGDMAGARLWIMRGAAATFVIGLAIVMGQRLRRRRGD